MNLLRRAKDAEAKLADTLDRTLGKFVRSGAREPLEIVHAIVDAVEAEVQSSGRGRRVFPFNSITASIVAPSRDTRARFEAILAGGEPLRERILARLASAGCHVDELDVAINYDSRPRKGWQNPDYHIEFARVPKPEKPAVGLAKTQTQVALTVLQGTADRRTYTLAASTRIDIGRCTDVRDARHHLIRTNHVAFVEGSGAINQTVSRRHAHISYDTAAGCFRVHDDGSEHGTGVVRHGRTLPVPRGSRGVRLESGDEIVLGDARLRVRFGEGVR